MSKRNDDEIKRVRRELKRIDDAWGSRHREAHHGKGHQRKIDEAFALWSSDRLATEEHLDVLLSLKLECRANQLGVPLPPRPKYNKDDPHSRLCHSSGLLKIKDLFFVRLSVNTVLSRFDSSRRTLPPCSSAIRRARVSPSPVPLGFPAVTNGSNKVLRTDAGIPGPLSEIVT